MAQSLLDFQDSHSPTPKLSRLYSSGGQSRPCEVDSPLGTQPPAPAGLRRGLGRAPRVSPAGLDVAQGPTFQQPPPGGSAASVPQGHSETSLFKRGVWDDLDSPLPPAPQSRQVLRVNLALRSPRCTAVPVGVSSALEAEPERAPRPWEDPSAPPVHEGIPGAASASEGQGGQTRPPNTSLHQGTPPDAPHSLREELPRILERRTGTGRGEWPLAQLSSGHWWGRAKGRPCT